MKKEVEGYSYKHPVSGKLIKVEPYDRECKNQHTKAKVVKQKSKIKKK
jgi:hypothetical protein